MIAPHAIQRHPSNAQPRLRVLHSGCRRACWAMMMRQARRSSAIQHYTVRCGFLSQRSYVAPSRQRRSSSKRPRKELTYCPIYGFKSFLICAKDLTPALFCPPDGSAKLRPVVPPANAKGPTGASSARTMTGARRQPSRRSQPYEKQGFSSGAADLRPSSGFFPDTLNLGPAGPIQSYLSDQSA